MTQATMQNKPETISYRPVLPKPKSPPRRVRFSLGKPFIYLALFSYFIIVVYPMFWLCYTSLKEDREIFLRPFSLPAPGHVAWNNYTRAWVDGHFGQYFFNSVLITSTTVLATTFLSAMTAYALARFVFPGVRGILFYFLAGLMIPLQLAIVPLFFQLKSMDLLDS